MRQISLAIVAVACGGVASAQSGSPPQACQKLVEEPAGFSQDMFNGHWASTMSRYAIQYFHPACLIWSHCYFEFDGEPTWQQAASNPDSFTRRVLNASSVLRRMRYPHEIDPHVGAHIANWDELVGEEVSSIFPVDECSTRAMRTRLDTGEVSILRYGHLDLAYYYRAAALAHEARHASDFWSTHTSDCPAGSFSCDGSYYEWGPYRRTVSALVQFAAKHELRAEPPILVLDEAVPLSSGDRADALRFANAHLNRNFEEHPGFNFRMAMVPVKVWGQFANDSAWENQVVSAPEGHVLTGLEVTYMAQRQPDGWLYPDLLGTVTYSRPVPELGPYDPSAPETVTVQGIWPPPAGFQFVSVHVDEGFENYGHVVVGARFRWSDTHDPPMRMELSSRRLLGGGRFAEADLPPKDHVSWEDGSAMGAPDSVFPSWPHHALTAFTIGADALGRDLGQGAMLYRIPRPFGETLGRQQNTEPAEFIGCSEMDVPIGLLTARHPGSPTTAEAIRGIGLLCAPAEKLHNSEPILLEETYVRHSTISNGPNTIDPGSVPGPAIDAFLTSDPDSLMTLTSCPEHSALRGVNVNYVINPNEHPEAISQVPSIRCSQYGAALPHDGDAPEASTDCPRVNALLAVVRNQPNQPSEVRILTPQCAAPI